MSHINHQEREGVLSDFCLSVAQQYLKDKKAISGEMMAELASRLIKAEVATGGPYLGPNGVPDLLTNTAVGYLFACFQKPLPNVEAFITHARTFETLLSPTLTRLLKQYDKKILSPQTRTTPPNEHQEIFQAAKRNLNGLQQPERSRALTFLAKIHHADSSFEIALLPTFFSRSLPPASIALPLAQLGEANILCWLAYSIYDKLLDDEPAAEYLPVANIAMRKTIQLYQSLFPTTHPFQQTLQGTFSTMDHANAWEVANCRFKRAGELLLISKLPHYGQNLMLARRSLGHVLGPLAIASLLEFSPLQMKTLEKGLRHYLIARQLSDDIHDWKEDFQAGHSSSVVTHLLKCLETAPGSYQINPLLARMERQFWDHSMETINSQIHRHLAVSRRHLLKAAIRKESEMLGLLTRLDLAASASASHHNQYKAFIAQYRALTADDSRQSLL